MSEAPTTVATICQTLNARIAAGEFAVGGKLPSERALSEQFATTRITLQEALGQLEAQGVIYRQVRRGWFISPPRLIYNPLQRSHFHAMAQQQGRAAYTEAIDSAVVTLDAPLAGRLALPPVPRPIAFAGCATSTGARCCTASTTSTRPTSPAYWTKI